MFTEKLGLGRAQDVSARMDLINSAGDPVYEKDDQGRDLEPGWLEFLGPEAPQVRRFGRSIAADELMEEKRQVSRRGMSKAQAETRIASLEKKAVEGLAIRLKAWRLVSIDGEVIDVPPTKENAEALFGNPEYGFLRNAALEFVGNPDNFFTKRAEPSSPSPETTSEDS